MTDGKTHGIAPATATQAHAPLCRSNQLSASVGFQGATQSMVGGVILANESSAACSLPHDRALVSLSWRGRELPTRESDMTTGPPWPRAHVLAPGAKANVFFQWWSCAGPGPRAAVQPTFTLRFGHGLLVSARAENSTPKFCSGLGGRRTLDVSRTLVFR